MSDYSLGYGASDQTSQRFALGATLRKSYIRSWGVITGNLQAEIGRDYQGGYSQSIYYLDTPDVQYTLTQAGSDSKHAAVGIGLEITSGLARFELDVYATQNGLYSEPAISVSLRGKPRVLTGLRRWQRYFVAAK